MIQNKQNINRGYNNVNDVYGENKKGKKEAKFNVLTKLCFYFNVNNLKVRFFRYSLRVIRIN